MVAESAFGPTQFFVTVTDTFSVLVFVSKKPQYLPKCDVAVLTATTLINQTFHQVSKHLKNAGEVCLVGPSTPLCPDLMREHGITLLAGSVVKDPKKALEIISQGGGTMALKAAMDQVLVRT